MAADYSAFLRSHLSDSLNRLGLAEHTCRQFGQNPKGYGAAFAGTVLYFRGHGRIVAIAYSPGDGVTCFVGREGADLAAYESWDSLWVVSGMAAGLDKDSGDSLDVYLRQFPKDRDAMLRLVVTKLSAIFSG